MDVGIQMYSVRDISEKSLKDALYTIASIGYKSVEFAGFFNNSAQQVRGWLDEFGLRVSGTHTMPAPFLSDFTTTVAYHKAIGNKNVVVPYYDISSREKLDELCASLAKLKPMLADEGIALHYHNHDFEFRLEYDGRLAFEYIAETGVGLEIDTYWVYAAGFDPLETLDKYHDRMSFYHLKDGIGGYRKNENGRPLGEGDAPIDAVWAKAKTYGLYPVVESETLTPSGADEARVCFEYIKNHYAER